MTDEYRNSLVKDLYELEVNCNICIEELADDITEDCKKFYQQGRADAISEFKQMALMVDYHYDFDNLTHEQKQELTDFTSNQVIKVIEMISNYMLEDHDADSEN